MPNPQFFISNVEDQSVETPTLLQQYLQSPLIFWSITLNLFTEEKALTKFNEVNTDELTEDNTYWIPYGILPNDLDNQDLSRLALFVYNYPPQMYWEDYQYHLTFNPFAFTNDQIYAVVEFGLTIEQVEDPRFDRIFNELLLENFITSYDYNSVAQLSNEEFNNLIDSKESYLDWSFHQLTEKALQNLMIGDGAAAQNSIFGM